VDEIVWSEPGSLIWQVRVSGPCGGEPHDISSDMTQRTQPGYQHSVADLQQRAEYGSEQLRDDVQAAAGPGAVAGQALGEGHRRVQVPMTGKLKFEVNWADPCEACCADCLMAVAIITTVSSQ